MSVFLNLAEEALKQKNYETAKSYAKEGLITEDIAEYHLILAACAIAEKDYDKALELNKTALTKRFIEEQDKSIPVNNISALYNRKKDWDNALIYNTLAIEMNPDNEDYFNNRRTILGNIKINVAWLIPSVDLTNPSVRVRRYNTHKKLQQLGANSEIIENYYQSPIEGTVQRLGPFEVVVFTQCSSYDNELMSKLKGKKILYDHCEALFDLPNESDCFNQSDVVVCCSTKLSELTIEHGFNNVAVIKDPIEPRLIEHDYVRAGREKLKAVFLGMGGNSWMVSDHLRETIEKAGYEVILVTEWDNATKKWDMNIWPEDMNDCDVVLCPQRTLIQPAKSNIKATQAMSMGMPVIASPIPSYKEVITNGENGYLCEEKEEWYKALVELKDPEKRKKIGEAAKVSVYKYTESYIASQWSDLFFKLMREKIVFKKAVVKPSQTEQPVDIIIINNSTVDKLKECLNSVLMNTDYRYNILISDVLGREDAWEYFKVLKGVTILGTKGEKRTVADACNNAVRNTSSKYFVLINSEVTVCHGWLRRLVEKMDTIPRLAVCCSYSEGEKFEETFSLPFTANIYARCAIMELGAFDPGYVSDGAIKDMHKRLEKYYYKTGIDHDSKVLGNKDYSVSDSKRFSDKWDKKKIGIYVFSPSSGVIPPDWDGMESWAAELSKVLISIGFKVIVYDQGNKSKGKEYHRSADNLMSDIQYDSYDYFIALRNTEIYKFNLHTNNKYVVINDLWMSADKSPDPYHWQIHKYIVPSEWNKKFIAEHHSISADKIVVNDKDMDPVFWKNLFSL